MKENTCCFTGHRTNDLPKNIKKLRKLLDKTIKNLIKRGVTTFIAGGAVGFDTLAAMAVLDIMKKERDY